MLYGNCMRLAALARAYAAAVALACRLASQIPFGPWYCACMAALRLWNAMRNVINSLPILLVKGAPVLVMLILLILGHSSMPSTLDVVIARSDLLVYRCPARDSRRSWFSLRITRGRITSWAFLQLAKPHPSKRHQQAYLPHRECQWEHL